MQKRLVLLVEGAGDVHAVPALVKRMISQRNAWDAVILDEQPIKVGGIHQITGNQACRHNWLRWLRVAAKRKHFGAALAVLDGDADMVEGATFCAASVARALTERARDVGAGQLFSVACAFACKEYESWLIGGIESLAGRRLPDGRTGILAGVRSNDLNPEVAPRDAKEWLSARMAHGYKQTLDQHLLTQMVDLNVIRARQLRSFRHLEKVVDDLIVALRTNTPCLRPA